MSDIDYDKMQRRAAYDDLIGPLYDPEPSQIAAHEAYRFSGPNDLLNKDLPLTPPSSAGSSSRPGFFARLSQSSLRDAHDSEPQSPFQQFLRRSSTRRTTRSTRSNRSNSVRSDTQSALPTHQEIISLLYTAEPTQTRWNQGTILSRANSVAVSNPTIHKDIMTPPRDGRHRRGQSLNAPFPQDGPLKPIDSNTPRRGVSLRDPGPVPRSQHILDQPIREGPPSASASSKGKSIQRERSLRGRFPGDMSHRPLDVIKQQTRAADRAPHLHSTNRQQPRDTIDTLDLSGPLPDVPYHHGGPFDPVMASRNTDPKTSPVEAVKDSNAEALRATPREHLADSLTKHVPLQGTATVPPGAADFAGRTMRYEEGADLMRERDAAGGAYKRWDHVTYSDADLKGKGEPSYTYERDLAKRKAVPSHSRGEDVGAIEMMQPRSMGTGTGTEFDGKAGAQVRHRSVKPLPSPPLGEDGGPSYGRMPETSSGPQRGGIVGSIKRKFGSLRRK